ncbi:hypothetical protein FPQ18DRAFT_28240 [Pyronema domesticum]|nr:hypothetical protein FPQ18DRAFT_28240 [Pyronema domesticum]
MPSLLPLWALEAALPCLVVYSRLSNLPNTPAVVRLDKRGLVWHLSAARAPWIYANRAVFQRFVPSKVSVERAWCGWCLVCCRCRWLSLAVAVASPSLCLCLAVPGGAWCWPVTVASPFLAGPFAGA